MELLWPGIPLESAQVNLRQTIYRLRQTFQVLASDGSELCPVVTTDRQSVGINPKVVVHLDVESFQSLSDRDPARAAELYRGDFLSDFYLVDSNPFEYWAEGIRERLRRTVLNGLDELTANAIEIGDYSLAQTYAWRQLEIDNLREGAYRQLMTALVGSGQRNAALSQFQICQQRLKDNLDIDPSQETLEVYTQIQADALKLTKAPPPKPKSRSVGIMPVFMLTDIESSTLLWDTHHQAMLPALLQHNSILEDQITQHGGRILELRGDGVKAVFEGGDPLRCQIDIQASLGSADWGEIGDLKIRIGLHGVPTVRKGYDYFEKNDQYYGPALNHTARIMDAGWGGQILVSERIRNSLTLPEGASWDDFGVHKVKSLENPIHIYGLMHPDLPDQSFPPLRTLKFQDNVPTADIQSIRHNLPSQQTPFIGRMVEISNLKNILHNPDIKLVTIVGPGGMGKTRLALATAENLITDCTEVQDGCPFSDGIIFVSLVPINDGDQILSTIANALNIPFDTSQGSDSLDRTSQSITTLKENLLGYLATKEILLILDNFEHLIDSAMVVSDILSYGTNIKILATSRERLRIREEQIFPIDGLKFPEWEAPQTPGEFTAIELFIQRAQRVKPDFDPGIEDMIYLTRICRLVGGMPLGLELASSWVDILSLKDIAAEIQTSLDFLESDYRNMPDRHRSIRAVFDSSWSRLSESEQLIFSRLTVFRSAFSREAAADVAKASLHNLAKFVDKSIVRFDQGNNRYHIHELLRQYGAEKLESSPLDEYDTRHRFSSHYCNQLELTMHQMMIGNVESRTPIQQVESLANIRGAWDWAIENGNIENVNKAINGICLNFASSMEIEEGLAICTDALEMISNMGLFEDPHQDPEKIVLGKRLYARVLLWKGYYHIFYDHPKARNLLNQSQTSIHELNLIGLDTDFEEVWVLFFQALIDDISGDISASQDKLHQGLALARSANMYSMVIRYLSKMGDIARTSGFPREAKRWYTQILKESRIRNNKWGEIIALNNLGWAARSMMVYGEAQHYFEESLELSKNNNYQWEIASALLSLGWLSLFLGNLDQATKYLSRAAKVTKEMGMPYRVPPSLANLGVTYWLAGDFIQAEEVIRESRALTNGLNPGIQLFPIICKAEFFTLMGRYPEAKDQIQILDTLTRDIFVERFTDGRLERVLGYIALSDKDYAGAANHFENSVDKFSIDTDDEQIAWSQSGWARALMGQGKWQEAQQLLTEALWTAIEIKAFIPMVFSLPIGVQLLAREDPELASHLYQKMTASSFISKAPFFEDITFRYLPSGIRHTSDHPKQHATDPNRDLWTTAARLLSNWIQVWIEEPENVEKKPQDQ